MEEKAFEKIKEKGLVATLKYDALVTAIRHPKISSGLIDYLYIKNESGMEVVAQGIILKSVVNNLEAQKLYQ